ncbi:malonate decarboxylase subunit delta [uncultured Desulfovibrio sp.]|uniref:malonate decarboxylase subunit delta n=1 Tax=uncultured Desulfovibrio sp. TaxID=167968 RepID=UPI0026173FFA|nr:malonate decarboxylase subunit delta [uncultured Desulfovibrio sp.]
METMRFDYPASTTVPRRVCLGVVASGDLEILLQPSTDGKSHVLIQTSVTGFGDTWKAVLDWFFSTYTDAADIVIHDAGATPGTVALRLQQAVEESRA